MKWMEILRYFYLLGAANALFFSFLIFSKPKRNLANKLLGFWLIILSLQLLYPFIYLADLKSYYKYAGVEVLFYAIHPLLLYLYIRAMTGTFPSNKKLLMLISLAVFAEITLLLYFLVPADERLALMLGEIPIKGFYYLFFIPIIVYFVFYIVVSINTLKNYKFNVLQIYSYKENIDLLWLRRLVLFFYGLLVATAPLGFVFYLNHISIAEGDYFFFAGLTFFIFFLGYSGYKQGEIFSFQTGEENKKENKNAFIHKTIISAKVSAKAVELESIMKKEKPYLNPTLTIYELARIVDMQPHQLSRLINKEFHSNFFEYINRHRIEYFKKYLISEYDKGFTLLAIALECGFNSKSAFNRIFKEQTGITPGEYKNQVFQNKVLKK